MDRGLESLRVRGSGLGDAQGANRMPVSLQASKQKEQSPKVQCCKVLRAVVFAKTKDWARSDSEFCDVNFPVLAGAFVLYSSRDVTPLLLDTGPPGAFSFAELILQQSLLAHAPPVLV